ncbi:MAG: hypothetical protein JSW11_08550 [Candidatus Heimdallarchaeota archaeon]|nr:MAG: hypothetical protein JSW11_08550 [Candidatus Heimdallarchaeota archaeon]
MRKYCITHLTLILILLMLIFPSRDILTESNLQNSKITDNNDSSLYKPSLELQQASNPEETILPKTNLTVNSYRDTNPQNTFNATVLSLNRTHWFIHCDYTFLLLDDISCDSVVDRVSFNHGYNASNYWEWHGQPSPSFDFWIDTTGFDDDYQFVVGEYIATVSSDVIYMANIDQEFSAWKITINVGIIVTIWYAADNGLFLCMKEDYVANIWWYNLTRAEIAQTPHDYVGPFLFQISHSNNSRLASNTLISIELTSPYGIDVIYYHWDDNSNSTTLSAFIIVNLPEENKSHDLIIIAFDNVGYQSFYHLIYTTDNTLPGISLINQRNNSKIRGSTHIQLQISSGNGTIFYRWDGGNNGTIDEGTYILVPNPDLEISHSLDVYVRGSTGLWAHSSFSWIVDNSPPLISCNFENNSIIKGNIKIIVFSSEDINLTYRLINTENRSVLINTGQNHTISYSNLINGSYQLFIIGSDEAHNIASITLIFSVYTSAFNWNWGLEAKIPRTIRIIDASSDLWFILTLTSAIDQSFNLTVLSKDLYPVKNDMIEYVIEFNCEKPDDIIFISLTLQLSSNNRVVPVYQWVHWDVESEGWVNITTSYNEVSNSWEATYNGFVLYFALINQGIKTTLTSVTPGGGQIPSFEIIPAIMSLIMVSTFVFNKRRMKKNSKRLGLN